MKMLNAVNLAAPMLQLFLFEFCPQPPCSAAQMDAQQRYINSDIEAYRHTKLTSDEKQELVTILLFLSP